VYGRFIVIILCGIFLLFPLQAFAQQHVVLTNGDVVTGTVIHNTDGTVTILSALLGTLTVTEEAIASVKAIPAPPALPAVEWKREVEGGYNITAGNTETGSFRAATDVNRKTAHNEITFKADASESSSKNKMNSQTWDIMGRYAFSFWQRKWYNFYKTEADHDRFADIDYRLTPSTGIGYWFSDKDPFKTMTELGIGYTYTKYNNGTADKKELVLIPRLYAEWKITGETRLSEELFLYPSLSDTGEYRLTSHTTLTNPITDALALRVRFTDEYNSKPANSAKSNDLQLTSSVVYGF